MLSAPPGHLTRLAVVDPEAAFEVLRLLFERREDPVAVRLSSDSRLAGIGTPGHARRYWWQETRCKAQRARDGITYIPYARRHALGNV